MKEITRSLLKSLGFEIYRSGNPALPSKLDPYLQMCNLTSNPNPVIFDVGANVGQTAIKLRTLFPNSSIYCFEPFPTSYAQLCAEVSRDPSIHCFQLALSEKTGSAHMTVNESHQTNSLLASDARAASYWGPNLLDTSNQIEVETETLESFCAQNNINHINILKLDAQGAEYAILKGGQNLFEEKRVDILYMEMIMAPTYVGQRQLHEYLSLLADWGYELFDLYNPYRAYGRLIQADSILVSSEFLNRYERSAMASQES